MTFSRPFYLLPFALLFCACEESNKEVAAPAADTAYTRVSLNESQYRQAGIITGTPVLRTLSAVVRANGKLDVPPQSKVAVSSPLGGKVMRTELLQGSRVRRNEDLVTLESLAYIQLQQEYLEVAGQLDFLKNEWERQKSLSLNEVNATKTVEKAKSEFQVAKARHEGLKARLEMLNVDAGSLEPGHIRSSLTLRSPIDGYVTKVLINIGSYVNPNDVMIEIVNTDHLHVELTLFEKDVSKLRVGQKVRFSLADESHSRTATVYLIGKEVGADRTVQVHCHLDKEDPGLLPGMFLQAVIETDSAHVLSLPSEALVDFEGSQYVFTQSGPNSEGLWLFTMHEVRAGESDGGYTQVTLPDFVKREKVVVKGSYPLLAKLKNREDSE